MTAAFDDGPASARVLREDARALRRGVAANLVGYAFAVLQPPLLVFVVRAYGAESFGLFTAANTVLWLSLRVGVLGLDKGLLWWVARADVSRSDASRADAARTDATHTDHAIRSSLLWVLGASVAMSGGIAWVFTPWIARWTGLAGAEETLRFMALGLVPMSLTELLLSVGLAQRRVGTKVFVRDGLLPSSLTGIALLCYLAGMRGPSGLAVAFVAAHGVALGAAWFSLRRSLPAPLWGRGGALPAPLVRYTRSAFAAELVNSLSQRIDVVIVAALTDARTLGVWAAVTQVGNAIRTIRRSFDPIVMTTFSKIAFATSDAAPQRERLVKSFSHATSLVLTTQTPVLVFLMAFAQPVLALFGEGFDQGTSAVVVLCAFWFMSGLLGLNGFVVSGYGRSDWILLDVLVSTLVQAVALVLLVPPFGLVGAAVGVGVSHLVLCVLQAWQARRVAGTWAYDRRVAQALGLSVASVAALVLLRAAFGSLGAPLRSIVAFAGSMLVFAGGFYRQRQTARTGAGNSPQLG